MVFPAGSEDPDRAVMVRLVRIDGCCSDRNREEGGPAVVSLAQASWRRLGKGSDWKTVSRNAT